MNEQTNQLEQFEGYVIFVLINVGTKSERYAPLLLSPGGSTMRLHLEGDYSLQSKSLLPYHKTWCKMSGQFDQETKTLNIVAIEEAADPFESISSGSESHDDFEEPSNPLSHE